MPASLKFESAAGTAAATLAEVKLVTLADNTGNKYTLDITTNDLKVAYTKNGGSKTEYTVNGLATALGKLLTIDGSTPGKSVLAEEAAKKPVVDVLVPALATVGTDDTKKVYTQNTANTSFVKTADLATKVAEKAVVKAIFSAKENVADTQSILVKEVAKEPVVKEILGVKNAAGTKTVLAEEVANKDVAGAILAVQDGKKSILVNKLGEALDRVQDTVDDKVYGAAGHEKIAKDFLADKYPFVKTDGSNISTQADKGKALADAILAVQDDKKSILVNKLGEALDRVQDTVDDKVYGTDPANLKIAKDFLADKYPFAKTDGTNIDKDFAGKVFDVTDGAAANPKSIAETKLGTTFAKINASNLSNAANKKAFAEAILLAKNGDKSILVDKLGDAIASADKAEYDAGTKQTAKQFLNSRGLIPSEDTIFTRLTSDDNFKTSVTIDVNASNHGFQGAVKEVMSQQHFEIPSDPSAPISADW